MPVISVRTHQVKTSAIAHAHLVKDAARAGLLCSPLVDHLIEELLDPPCVVASIPLLGAAASVGTDIEGGVEVVGDTATAANGGCGHACRDRTNRSGVTGDQVGLTALVEQFGSTALTDPVHAAGSNRSATSATASHAADRLTNRIDPTGAGSAVAVRPVANHLKI